MDIQEKYNKIPESSLNVPLVIWKNFTLWDCIYFLLVWILSGAIFLEITILPWVVRIILFVVLGIFLTLGLINKKGTNYRYWLFFFKFVLPYVVTKKKYKNIVWKYNFSRFEPNKKNKHTKENNKYNEQAIVDNPDIEVYYLIITSKTIKTNIKKQLNLKVDEQISSFKKTKNWFIKD